jgi:hypothetical protein
MSPRDGVEALSLRTRYADERVHEDYRDTTPFHLAASTLSNGHSRYNRHDRRYPYSNPAHCYKHSPALPP